MSTRKASKTKSSKTKPKSGEELPKAGYAGHKPGRRKGQVHELFDSQGPEAAWTLGCKLGLKESTLRSWFATWKRLAKNKLNDLKVAA